MLEWIVIRRGTLVNQILSFYVLLFCFICANAQALEVRRGEDLDLQGRFEEALFAAGERVSTNVESSDDVFIAAGRVTQTGGSADNLFVAGGDVNSMNSVARLGVLAGGEIDITRGRFRDLIFAGGEVRVDDTHVEDDAILAGGEVEILKSVRIDDSLALTGGEVKFAGKAGGDAVISGNEVEITGTFAKNLRLRARHAIIGPNAKIQGDLMHEVERLELSPGAIIGGQTIVLSPPYRQSGPWLALGGMLVFIGILLIPAVIARLFPKFTDTGADDILGRFWISVGRGALGLLLAPLIISLLFASVIGAPLATISIPFLLVAFLMAWAISAHVVGRQLRTWYRRQRSGAVMASGAGQPRMGWTMLGAFSLALVMSVPFIGFAFGFVLFVAALGAIIRQMGERIFTRPRPSHSESDAGLAPT